MADAVRLVSTRVTFLRLEAAFEIVQISDLTLPLG